MKAGRAQREHIERKVRAERERGSAGRQQIENRESRESKAEIESTERAESESRE